MTTGKCRFDSVGYCETHGDTSSPDRSKWHKAALCTHAAQELERHLREERTSLANLLDRYRPASPPPDGIRSLAEWVLADLESRLARAQDDAAHAAKNFDDANALLIEREKELSKYHEQILNLLEGGHKVCRRQLEKVQHRLAQAEAAAAAMREALIARTHCATCHTGDRPILDNGRYIHLYGDGSFLGPCFDPITGAALSPDVGREKE